MINYNNKTFCLINSTENGQVNNETFFYYTQKENIVTAQYNGGGIVNGHLIAVADADGKLDMRYHHINTHGEIMTGICLSEPELLPNGKIRLHEKWQWTGGDNSSGSSIVEEI